ncbi:major facilitator superfamily domain-containing protein [Lasiosphaeria miniovina]|uniref:Major facilitator superfamily domain-containing protein n=1 Tax=Lasiosphaeria miniovina TaxID=1954250 RepID=A0AA40DRZ5_9PEZI|nr:major facilitator superfamily domain-containing protein [Lasiosphaeria miniovina]KAK0713375.1 major facilitator superfamily domain-containing protein [Lasiosphaeria miniovina]
MASLEVTAQNPAERSGTLLEAPTPADMSTAPTPAISAAPTIEKNMDSDVEKSGQTDTARTVRGVKWVLILFAIYVIAFLYGLDTTIAADVQGPVIEAFGHVEQLPWIGSGFPLGSVAVIALVGTLYGHFNMKWTFLGGLVLFEVGSVLCGAAPNMNALIVGRVLAGAGGAGIYLGGLNYVTALTAPEERGLFISGIGFFWGVGAVLGPVIGGAFASSSATWRWAFYINIVIGAVVVPIFLFLIPSIHPNPGKTVRERVEHFDFIGLVLIAVTWVLFAVAFLMAGAEWAWDDGRTIAVIVVFGYFTVLTTAATRAFPGHLILSRTQVLLFAATAASSSSLFIVVYYIPIYFQFVHSDSAIQAAVRLLPFIIITVFTNVAAGYLLSKVRYYMPIYLAGGVLITLGGALLMSFLDAATSIGKIYGFQIIIAVGTGLTIQLGYAVATLTVKPEDIGNAITFQNMSQLGSTVLCLVIAGQVFQSAAVSNLTAALAGNGFAPQEITEAIAGAQSALFGELSGALRAAAIDAIVKAMQKSFILVIVAGAVMVVSSVLMKREKLFGDIVQA